MYPIKEDTAITIPVFAHDASGDAVTGMVDGGFTKRISKNGGAFAAMAVTIAEMENGWYEIPLTSSHTDTAGVLSLTFTNASCKQINVQLRVHARLPDDLAYPATSGRSIGVEADGHVHADVKEWLGTAPNALSSGRVDGDVGAISTDSGAADSLEAILDGTGDVMTLTQLRINSSAAGGAINIDNSAGPAISATTASAGQHAVSLVGNGSGNGINAQGGATGNGAVFIAGATSGAGLVAISPVSGNGIQASGAGAGTDISGDLVGDITGNLSGSVGSVTGNVGGTINGLTAAALADFFDTDSGTTYGAAVAGSVVKEIADNASIAGGVDVTSISGDSGAADALEAILDGTGAVMTLTQLRINAAAAGGGIDIDNSAGPAISAVTSNATSNGAEFTGNTTGHGIKASGGSAGHGLYALAGASDGDGFRCQAQGTGNGFQAIGGATAGDGFLCDAGLNGRGFRAQGHAAGAGFSCEGGATGNGATFQGGATSGDGLYCVAPTSGRGAYYVSLGGVLPGFRCDSATAAGFTCGGSPNMQANIAGTITSVTNPVTVGTVNAAALADFFNTDSGTTYGAAVAGSVVKEIADNAGGSALTEAGIADAVWNEDIVAAHGGADSAGLILSQLTSRTVVFNTAVDDDSIIGQLADNGVAAFDRSTDSLQAIADASPGVDVVSISGDAAAADALEAILDGTGAVMTLSQLRINSAAAGGAIDIDNSVGPAISAIGDSGVYIEATDAVAGNALELVASGVSGTGLAIAGAGGGSGILSQGGLTGHGAECRGGGTSGHGLYCRAFANGNGLQIEGAGGGTPFNTAATDQIEDAIWERAAAGFGGGTMGALVAALTLDGIADAVWDEDIVTAHGALATSGLILSMLVQRGTALWPGGSNTFLTGVDPTSVVGHMVAKTSAPYAFDRTTDSLEAIADATPGGTIDANVVSIDGDLTAGNNAILNLKQLNIVNSTGDAILAQSTGANGHGMQVVGNGSGNGMLALGGPTGRGLDSRGGATSGEGIRALALGTNQSGLRTEGTGSGAGIVAAAGGAAGSGFVGVGGAAGQAFRADPASGLPLSADIASQISDQNWDEILTGATHNIPTSAGRRLRNIQDFGIYDMASVWVDEVNGTSTGTIDGEDATVTNRADDFDNAQTVAVSVGLDTVHIQAGNSITLTAGITNFRIWGANYALALGGQTINGCIIENATLSGAGTGTAQFINCIIGVTTLDPGRFVLCSLTNTLTVGSAGNYQFIQCQSGVAGSSVPIVDLGAAVGATTMEFRRWSGGLTLNNVQAGDIISIDVVSGGTITINGTGGTVVIRGMCNVVDGSAGAVSITSTSVLNQLVVSDQVWQETLADHSGTVGSTAEALAAAAAGGGGGDATLANQVTILANQANIEADTQDIQTRLPAVLVGGRMDASIGEITVAALADFFDTDSGTTYGAAVAGSVVREIADNAGGSALTEAGIAAAVWQSAKAVHRGETIMGNIAEDTDNMQVEGRPR